MIPLRGTMRLGQEVTNTFDWKGRIRLSVGVVLCFSLFWWAGRTFHMPPVRGLDGSLMNQQSPAVSFLVAGVTLVVATLIGKFVVGDLFAGTGATPRAD